MTCHQTNRSTPNIRFYDQQTYIAIGPWYERVCLPLYEVADTPFHIQYDDKSALFMLQWPLM